jgi:hypothetical protein
LAFLVKKKKTAEAQKAALAKTPQARNSRKKTGKVPVQPVTLPQPKKSQPRTELEGRTYVQKSADNPAMWMTPEGKRRMEQERLAEAKLAARKKAHKKAKPQAGKTTTLPAVMSDDEDIDDDEPPARVHFPQGTGHRSAANDDSSSSSSEDQDPIHQRKTDENRVPSPTPSGNSEEEEGEEEEEEDDEGDEDSVAYGGD